MPAPISMDLRLRIVGAVEHGSSIREEKAAALAMVGGDVRSADHGRPALRVFFCDVDLIMVVLLVSTCKSKRLGR
jgi:hypothetical protein